MGKKAVIISGVVCLILVSLFGIPAYKHLYIEGYIQDLYSIDKEVSESAVNKLSEVGIEIIPRLLTELENQPRLNPDKYFFFNRDPEFGDVRPFDIAIVNTFTKLGEKSLPILIEQLSSDYSRLNAVIYSSLIFIYGEKAGGGVNSDFTVIHSNPKNLSTIKTGLISGSHGWRLYQVEESKAGSLNVSREIRPEYKKLLIDIGVNKSLLISWFHPEVGMGDEIRIDLINENVIKECNAALERLVNETGD